MSLLDAGHGRQLELRELKDGEAKPDQGNGSPVGQQCAPHRDNRLCLRVSGVCHLLRWVYSAKLISCALTILQALRGITAPRKV
jgi:hypothetical protein